MSKILIAAVSENDVIGSNGKIPWNIPEDLQRFKSLTLGGVVIMGRKTFESLPIKPLPKRTNIVLSRDYSDSRVIVKKSLSDALEYCRNYRDVFFIGGRGVYEEALPWVDVLELTRVHKKVRGDVYFPKINFDDWQITRRESHDGFSFLTYKRK